MSAIHSYIQPRFVGGQRLTATDLNNIVNLIEPQSRQSRRGLIGVGISCGFEVMLEGGEVRVTKGAAVSSDGCLFYLSEDASFIVSPSEETNLSQLKPGMDKVDKVARIWKIGASPDGNFPDDPPADFPSMDDAVYILVKEFERASNSNSICNDLEPTGINNTVNLCIWALSKEDANELWTPPPTPIDQQVLPCSSVQRLPLYEMTFRKEEVNLSERYREICANAINGPIKEAYAVVLEQADLDKMIGDLNNLLETVHTYNLQYLWMYLKDLVAAYEEWALACTEVKELAKGCTEEELFPNFVMLGTSKGACRMDWYPVHEPLSFCDKEKLEKRDCLLKRLKFLAHPDNLRFNDLPPDIKITGSQPKHLPLSQLAIPFYYNKMDELRELWNYKMKKCRRWKLIPGYDRVEPEGLLGQQLGYDLEKYDFFRVEGHIGQSVSTVFDAVTRLRNELNLPFKVLVVKHVAEVQCIDSNTPLHSSTHPLLFGSFAQVRPGLEHMSGVPKGGTLVLVVDPNKDPNIDHICPVIADFCLPYSQEERPAAMFHERLREYIGNRVTLFFTNDSLLAERYIWEVWEITSTGQLTLITGFTHPDPHTMHDLQLDIEWGKVRKIRVRLSAYLDMWEDHFTHDYDLQEEHPPSAHFHEESRSYIVEDGNQPCVLITLANDSVHAVRYEWEIEITDKNGNSRTEPLITSDDLEPIKIKIEIKEEIKVKVKLTAINADGDFDEYIEEIKVCPKKIKLTAKDPIADSEIWLEEITIPYDEDIVIEEIGLKFWPPGSSLSILPALDDFAAKLNIEDTESAVLIFDTTAKPVEKGNYPLEYIVESTYPCKGHKRQVRIIFMAPPPEGQNTDVDVFLLDQATLPQKEKAKSKAKPITKVKPTTVSIKAKSEVAAKKSVKKPPVAKNPVAMLNARRNNYRKNVEALIEGDRKLANTKSYKNTHRFITAPPLKYGQWHRSFEEIAKLLLLSASRPGGVSDEKYLSLLQNACWHYLDRTIGEKLEQPPAEMEAIMKAMVPKMASGGISLPAFLKEWKAGEIESSTTKALITSLKRFFGKK